jgi:ABC-2 type transport system permease protein
MKTTIADEPGTRSSKMSPRRIRALLGKEFVQIIRDPSSIAIALVLPVFLILLIGYGLSLDAKEVPVAVVLENPTPDSTSVAGAFKLSDYFKVTEVTSMQ